MATKHYSITISPLAVTGVALVLVFSTWAVVAAPSLIKGVSRGAAFAEQIVSPSETVIARVPFERQVVMSCVTTNNCKATILTVPPKHRYEQQSALCNVLTKGGTALFVELTLNPGEKNKIFVNLGLTWLRTGAEGESIYNFANYSALFAKEGQTLIADLLATTSTTNASADCQVFGTMVTLK